MTPIDGIDVAVYRIPVDPPESDGTLTWDHTTVVVVEPTGAGVRGLGFTYAPRACGSLIADVLAPIVVGLDVQDPPRAWRAMVAAIRNLGRPGIASAAIAAVDIALWDLEARLAGEPLCRHLGAARAEVPIYGSGGFTSLPDDELCAQLAGWVHEQGIPRVKMKTATDHGRDERRDLDRVALARKAIGDGADLFVDANGGYARKQSVRMSRAFGDHGVTWFEEPVSSDDLEGLHEIRSRVDMEVAAGEYGYDLAYFERMCAAGAVDCLQADVSRCAGITEWLRVAAVAAAHGLEVSGHCAPSLHAHPACAIQNLRHVEYFADHVRADRLLFDGVLEPVDGVLRPHASGPGLGLTLRRPDAERYRIAG
jgi:L-alanine-DL-glutamate epimerase-like enolase superfamily enzyme